MTVKTLTYIHNLLKEEVSKLKDAHTYIKTITTEAKEKEAPNADFLQRQTDKAWSKYIDAMNALEDFENKEW